MHKHKRIILIAALALSTCAAIAGLVGGLYEIGPLDINSGGERSTSNNYTITASTGQAGGVGVLSSTNYELNDGFQRAALSPDCDGNGVADEEDIRIGTSADCNVNHVPDACDVDETDPDGDGLVSDDCSGNGVPDECETALATWSGPNAGAFTDPDNWDAAVVPTRDAVLSNAGPTDNRAVLSASGETAICNLTINATGNGNQVVEIAEGSVLRATQSVAIETGGVVALKGGRLTGAPVALNGTIRGHGTAALDIDNAGTIEGSSLGMLLISGDELTNAPTGRIHAPFGSFVNVQAANVTQRGVIEVRSFAGLLFAALLTNEAGAEIHLLGGSLGADGLTNEFLASMSGFGRIESFVNNFGTLTIVADTEITGNFANAGLLRVQNGVLSIVGDLNGDGTVNGAGGTFDIPEDAPRAGDGVSVIGDFSLASTATLAMGDRPLKVGGDFDVAIDDSARVDLTQATLQLVGLPEHGPQRLEMPATDMDNGVTLPNATLMSIDTLRCGPTSPSVKLVDMHDNSDGAEPEALYVRLLVLEPGTRLELNGLRIYYETAVPPNPFGAGSGLEIGDAVGGGNLVRIGSLPGDFNDDGAVDMADAAELLVGLDGPEVTPGPAPPRTTMELLSSFDFDGDRDLDTADFATFQQLFAPVRE